MIESNKSADQTPAQLHRRNVAGGFAEDAEQFALAAKLTDLRQRLIVRAAGRKGRFWNGGLFRRRVDP